ncbi:NAD-dependent epimerase/dehydratase-like protein [Bisporella sp. PMI_857]|nr:NAD-dependent epimerase/dehydratase-like protein [Bisporella sp. PMI_857]
MSRILIIGGSGRTGLLTINEALARGHAVTALVRNPSRIESQVGLTLIKGTPLEESDIERAITTTPDVPTSVIITLANARTASTPALIITSSVLNAISAMRTHDLKKLVVMSSFGTADSYPNVILPMRFAISHTSLGISYKDHDIVDREVKGTELEWVLVRPNRLTDGENKVVKVFDDAGKEMGGLMSISRSSVASFLLDAVELDMWNRRTPTIAN